MSTQPPVTTNGGRTPFVAAVGEAAPAHRGGTFAALAPIPFAELFAPVSRHRILVAALTIGCGSLAAAYVWWDLPRYRAVATLRLENPRQSMTSGIEAPEKGPGPMTNPVISEIQALRSRSLIGRVVDTLGLRLRPDFHFFNGALLRDVKVAPDAPNDTLELEFGPYGIGVRGIRERATAAYGQPLQIGRVSFVVTARPRTKSSTWFVVSRERAIDLVLNKLVITPRVMSDVVDISYTGYRPTVTQNVVNGVVNGFLTMGIDNATAAARKRRVFLENQVSQNDSLLRAAEQQLIAFRERARVYRAPAKMEAQQRDLMSLEQRWSELRAIRASYQELLDGLQGLRAGRELDTRLHALAASPELAGNPVVGPLFAQLVRHEASIDSLTAGPWRRSESDPDVQRTRSLLNATNENLLGVVRGYLESVDSRIRALGGVRQRSTADLVALPSLDVEEARLSRRVAILATLSDYLRNEHQKARIAEGAEVGRAVILDHASKPYAPMAQLRVVKLTVGTLGGLFLGIFLSVLIERKNTSIRRREDLELAFHVPVMGLIPRLYERQRQLPLRHRLMPGSARPAATPSGQAAAIALEAYRMLRANLTFARPDQPVRSIVLTSAAPGEGKTTTAANLALACAREEQRVVVLDCDLRRGRLHVLFSAHRSPGLAQVLDGRVQLDAAIQPTQFRNLYLVPAGQTESGIGELLAGAAMRRVLESLLVRFDMVILDAPPALAVADSAIIGALADGVVLVVRAGVTGRAAAESVLRQLGSAGATVLGAVINDPAGELEDGQPYYAQYVNA